MSVEVYPSQWRKASVKAIVGERESDAEALTQAKTFLEDWFNKSYGLSPDANKIYTTGRPYEDASNLQEQADAEWESFKNEATEFMESSPNEEQISAWLKDSGWYLSIEAKSFIKQINPEIKL